MAKEQRARITVRVQPNASQNEILNFKDEVLYIRIAAPPVKGKANQALIKFLSNIMETSKSSLTIEKGMTGRNKIIGFSGLTQSQMMEQLGRLISDKEDKKPQARY